MFCDALTLKLLVNIANICINTTCKFMVNEDCTEVVPIQPTLTEFVFEGILLVIGKL